MINSPSTNCLNGQLDEKKVVRVTCWELKSHPFKALVLLAFTYIIEIWGGDFKNSHEKELEKVDHK
jgi:hypothetical protein